jgi:large subunit ribosomal protein L24
MAKLKTNDLVIVIAGKDKGKQGTITKVLNGTHVIVDGVNKVKKHKKPNPQQGIQGGIVEHEKAIHISNVAILNQQTNKADRVKYETNDNGQKVRVFASNAELIDL